MKNIYWIVFPLIILLSSCLSSRLYKPASDRENSFYIKINKSIWPDDVRYNINNYKNELVGWVGIVEQYRIERNIENIIVHFSLNHHYYDWIEDYGYSRGPILLSTIGEGIILGKYILSPELTDDQLNEMTKDFLGECIIIYGYPNKIMENGEILLDMEYTRTIPKKYVDPNWREYGRQGFMGEKK